MAIIVDNDTKLVVQGLTGSEGRFHGLRNRAYGTNVVAGVTPGKGGQGVEGIPVFDTVVDALEVITHDPQVKSIFFNIFGGITRCDEVARGILEALDRLDMSQYPIVVRLDGTNAEEGRKILADAGKENIHPEATMLAGAERAVRLAGDVS